MVALFDAVDIQSQYVHVVKADPINPSYQWSIVRLDGKRYHLDVQMIDSSYSGKNNPILLRVVIYLMMKVSCQWRREKT